MPLTPNRFVKLMAMISLFATSASATPTERPDKQFYSWYDGWGTHNVWGMGNVAGSYSEATVKCGKETIKVIPIYDTHVIRQPPTKAQSSAFAETHNLILAKELSEKGNQCAFAKAPPS